MMDPKPLASLSLLAETIEAARVQLAAAQFPDSETLNDLRDALNIAALNAQYLSAEIAFGMQTPADRKAIRV